MFQQQGFMGAPQVIVRAGGFRALDTGSYFAAPPQGEPPLGQPLTYAVPGLGLRGNLGGSMMHQVPLRLGTKPGETDVPPFPSGGGPAITTTEIGPPQGPPTGQVPLAAPPGVAPAPDRPISRPLPERPTRPDRVMNVILRMCTVLRKLAEKEVGEEIAARIFWSYADHANLPTDMVTKLVSEHCPEVAIPPRPTTPPKQMKRPEKEGFRGKTRLSYEEAQDLSELLTIVLAPLTPEEAASELADRECLRELTDAGGFPIVERLQERLKEFLATAQPTDTFEISKGEVVVTGKAVECADALGRLATIRTVATAGGIGGAGLLLFLLL